jgi:hypothetical protein
VTYDKGGQVIDRIHVLLGILLWEPNTCCTNWFEAKIPKEVRTGCDGTAQQAQIDSLVWVIGCDTPFLLIKLERGKFPCTERMKGRIGDIVEKIRDPSKCIILIAVSFLGATFWGKA